MSNTTAVVRGLKQHMPDAILKEYSLLLTKLTLRLKSLAIRHLENNNKFIASYNRSVRIDDVVDDLESGIRAIKLSVARQLLSISRILPDIFSEVRSFARRSVKRSIVHIENTNRNIVGIGFNSGRLPKIAILQKNWVYENTRLIKSIPAQMLDKVLQSVSQAVREGESVDSLKNRLLQITDITSRRAKIIARDQISKLRASLLRHESLSRGITHYEWSTSGDEAVRASHKVMNGKICSWLDADIYKNSLNDSSWKKRASIGGVQQHPGEDILCRCTSFLVTNIENIKEAA